MMLFRIFYARPLLLTVILFVASVLGIAGYLQMPRNMYPDVERPQVTVITMLPGASAESVTQKISRIIEQELYTLQGIRDVQSTNKNEVSIVRAEFEYTKGMDPAMLDVNNAMARLRGRLPPEAQSSIYSVGGFTAPVLVLALTPAAGSHLTLTEVRWLAENDIRNAFLTQPNIANVDVFGGYEPAVRIEFDPARLARHRISQARLQQLISNLDKDWPVGMLSGSDGMTTLTVYGERATVASLRVLPVGEGLTLGDVAEVSLGHAKRYSAFHGNGMPAIAVSIMRAPGGSVQAAIEDAQGQLTVLEQRYPNIHFEVADTQADLINVSNANMIEALRDAIIFVALVMLLFLTNWRAVVTSLISIPLVFLLTLAVLWLMGKELNILVMTGIILALGMLVDDVVVVLENIERHLEESAESVETAIVRGTEEVIGPIFLGTLACSVVIAPLMFVGDFPEEIFSHLVLPVLISVFVSYFLSLTFIPRMSLLWYRNGLPQKNRFELALEKLYQRTIAPGAGFYRSLLRAALERRFLGRVLYVLPAIAMLLVSFNTVLPLIGRDGMPPMDTGIIKVHLRFGANDTVASAEARLRQFEEALAADERVTRVSASFGSEPGVLSLGSGQLPAETTYTIAYVSRLEREQSSWDIEADLRRMLAEVPGIVTLDVFGYGATALSTIKAPVNIRLQAEDWRLLPEAADAAAVALRQIPGITSVSASWDRTAKEAVLSLDEQKMRQLGLTPDQVVAQLPFKERPVASLSKLPSVSALPVRMYFAEPYGTQPQTLALVPIYLSDGTRINLGDIGTVRFAPATSVLTTNGLKYSIDLLAYRETAPISRLSAEAEQAVRDVLPPGVTFRELGDNASARDSGQRMVLGLALGVLLLFAVLAPAYGSIGLAILSIAILPLSVIGAFWGLLAFDKALALPAILGVILLFSIIIKNSILMVDFIQTRRAEGASPMEAAEGSVVIRYRPILMTALATIAGMIPIAVEQAVGLERLSPLADAAIGGLLVGTFLSLFYLPLFYVWVTERSNRLALSASRLTS